ncbi:guided entry of tail-anchored proteins factor 1 [Onthophagus taurus]|uniref:guided entry of tail-anchored proteins factor 1 n=1 Tax=Onthophagus taurus TaxID=166361 RepID=UPI0039BDCBF5
MFVDSFLFTTILLLSVLNAIIPDLSAKYINPLILKYLNSLTPKQRELREEIRQLKLEQSKLQIVNDFVKHTKIQRRINMLNMQYSELQTSSSTRNMIVKVGLPYLFRFLMGVAILCFIIMYRNNPVMILNESINFTPFGRIISYPNTEINAVSVHFWVMCCSTVIKLVQLKV